MLFSPISIALKDGREAILRSPDKTDAQAFIDYMVTTAGETPYLLRAPEEISLTLEQEEAFLENALAAPRRLMLSAFVDGRLAGNAAMNPVSPFMRYKHRCTLAISLYQEFTGLGLGKAMLETILKAAKSAGYEQAELTTVSTNASARALYAKLGFVEYGTQPHSRKMEDGSYQDEIFMVKTL